MHRIGEHEAVGRIAVFVYEIEKPGEVGRKVQAGSTSTAFYYTFPMIGIGANAATLPGIFGIGD
jgi:hypothetical protein